MADRRSGLAALLGQFMRFGVVGAFGFVTDVGGFNLLVHSAASPLNDRPLTAKLISGAAATVVAWLGNRYWTFRHTRMSNRLREFVLFSIVAMVGTGIAMGVLAVSRYVLHLTSPLADNIAANGIGLGLALLFRFWAYRTHVFSEVGDGSGLSQVEQAMGDHAGHHHEHASPDPGDQRGATR